MLERYSVTLEKEIVDEAKKKIKKYGGKLSPIINQMLKDWVIKNNEEENL